jgi:alpha-tubulin suppressor-like RCC1 family protein
VIQSGDVFHWGETFVPGEHVLRPTIVEGFGGVRVRRVCGLSGTAFVIGEDGELFSWGHGRVGLLGHGDTQGRPSPKEALRGVRVSDVSVGLYHALALTEDGLVYAWGKNEKGSLLGNPRVKGLIDAAEVGRGAPGRARGQHCRRQCAQLRGGRHR